MISICIDNHYRKGFAISMTSHLKKTGQRIFRRIKAITSCILFISFFVALALLTSCKYDIGETGPAGGYIFYDCDADNTKADLDGSDNLKSDACGWRYLEAAPADETDSYIWGGNWQTNDIDTSAAIGKGKVNTDKILATYKEHEPGMGSADYAARICTGKSYTYKGKTYADWFLPSKYELVTLYSTFKKHGINGLAAASYWTSSAANGTAIAADFSNRLLIPTQKDRKCHIRAIRAF
jgi:hypothetical protein